ncbi:IDEAL domain-containing protein [Bacillus salacetis]|uniref:IDEAL domain-containing protein n=1 Tax=Bacillus salacetis TaxID=2315464 RepID=A0A3A1R173_9BACI|nr:IDEAL domain-containing protein [Bacillus salacetis]RIW34687.1 IDEAL domain-containing protein [Bacillus salacetis]
MNEQNILKGDWVKAKSVEGELVIGYIESVNKDRKTARLKVVQAEEGSIAGRSIETLLRSVTPLQSLNKFTKEYIMELIDLALLTRDEEWFNELTDELKKYEKKPTKEKETIAGVTRNRLIFPHVK